jgi:hypothetical protein
MRVPKLYDSETNKLYDKRILELLKRLPEMYENGELVEVEQVCSEIQYAIRLFSREYYIDHLEVLQDEV